MLNCTTNAVFCVKNYLKYASIPANFCLEYDIIYAICQMPLGIWRCPTKNKIKNLSQNNPFRQTLLFQNMRNFHFTRNIQILCNMDDAPLVLSLKNPFLPIRPSAFAFSIPRRLFFSVSSQHIHTISTTRL